MAGARQAKTWDSVRRKSPLRVVDEVPAVGAGLGQAVKPRCLPADSPAAVRQMMISEFCDWLRLRTNRHGRPFREDTVLAYRDAAAALDAWMTRTKLEADFTGCDAAVLNRFFADYLTGHSQNGTNTKQRNLRHLSGDTAARRPRRGHVAVLPGRAAPRYSLPGCPEP